ncbi:MAG: hypothetical protein PVSMB4_10770 [Ktedonobacterales bacterium]
MTAPQSEPQTEPAIPPAMARADELLTQWGQRVGYFASAAGQRLRKAIALAREEAEDVWAEAQNVRRQNGLNGHPSPNGHPAPTTDHPNKAASHPQATTGSSHSPRRARKPVREK